MFSNMQLWKRYREALCANWHLGFTTFGGPAVQFQTFHKRFVEDLKWIDEAMVRSYTECGIYVIDMSTSVSADILPFAVVTGFVYAKDVALHQCCPPRTSGRLYRGCAVQVGCTTLGIVI